jgi:hypothetical protein
VRVEQVQYLKIAIFIIWKYFGKWCEGANLIHPLARDVKETFPTRKRQLAADSDSNSLTGVLLLTCHNAIFIIWKYFGKWCEAKCFMCNDGN